MTESPPPLKVMMELGFVDVTLTSSNPNQVGSCRKPNCSVLVELLAATVNDRLVHEKAAMLTPSKMVLPFQVTWNSLGVPPKFSSQKETMQFEPATVVRVWDK